MAAKIKNIPNTPGRAKNSKNLIPSPSQKTPTGIFNPSLPGGNTGQGNTGLTNQGTLPSPIQSYQIPGGYVRTPSGDIVPSHGINPPQSGGGGGGGYGGYDPGYDAPPPIDYSKLDNDALGGYDSIFQAQLAALQAALSGQLADFTARRSQYDVDMNEALRQLGISGQVFDDPTTPDVDESTPGQWMWRDLNTAAGRANYNLKNDYASRGILQSSLFGDALTNLQRSLNEQVESIGNARSSFLSDLARQQAAAEEENRNAIANARAEALARLVHGITL